MSTADQLTRIERLLMEIRDLLNEQLDRPKPPTILHLSALSKVQLERFAKVFIETVRKIK